MAGDGLVLVTGISGFIGKHCAVALLNKGYRVRGTIRSLQRADAVRATLAKHAKTEGRLEFAEADLTSDKGWAAALQGCQYVLHVASPFPMSQPKDRDGLVGPAREGTLRVLKAAADAGVSRTVLTSSTVSIMFGAHARNGATLTEENWSDADDPQIRAYARSKTLAERAAWEFVKTSGRGMELAVINPGFVLGPALDADIGTSLEIIRMMLRGKYPAAPKLHFPIVDVRDVADMHVAAMTNPKAAGERFLCAERSMWVVEMARAIRSAIPEARKVPTKEMPNFIVRVLGMVDPRLGSVLPELGLVRPISHAKADKVLGFRFRSAEEASAAAARSLIDLKLV